MTAFTLGANSRKELQGVHPKLVEFVEATLKKTTQDFGVHDGLRTKAEQLEYVKSGVSQTTNSKHLTQADGYGHAVDLVPYINGKLRWEWPPIYQIAYAASQAAHELGIRVRWGGCWEELPLLKNAAEAEKMVAAYSARRRKVGKKAFMDGPHWELIV